MGMQPRWIKEGSIYSQTQRTVDRAFLFKPDPVICPLQQRRQSFFSPKERILRNFLTKCTKEELRAKKKEILKWECSRDGSKKDQSILKRN